MIFNSPLKTALGVICGLSLFNTPAMALETKYECKQIIYIAQLKVTKNAFAICESDGNLFMAWEEGDAKKGRYTTEVRFDKEMASWSKSVKTVKENNKNYKITETSFKVEGTKSKFILTSTAKGLENNTYEGQMIVSMDKMPMEVLTFDPTTVINGIGPRLQEKYGIEGEVSIIK